jgi:ABC-2 type transport system ATP-binding protein
MRHQAVFATFHDYLEGTFMIQAKNLNKLFRSYKKEEGFKGSLKNLLKRDYQDKFAVKDFNLEVAPGEILGLLGPNGAGKTTLMKMMTGIIVPSSGELKVLGYAPYERSKEFRKKIALVMGQKSQLWWDIPAMDSFRLIQSYYQIPSNSFNNKLEEMSILLDVAKVLHVHVRKLSLGERMKLELIASLLHSPEILFLDEPTIGLDLISQENIRHFIRDYQKAHKVTVILTSHYMTDVAELCHRLVLIMDGTKAYDGKLKKFENLLGSDKCVSFYFNQEQEVQDPFLTNLGAKWEEGGKKLEMAIPAERLREISTYILQKYPVSNFESSQTPIEKVMKTVMKNPELLKG